ncbi:MAG TPA: hypothetical protein VGV89_10355 [Thermoplasmata archaeon]|nr:hypothetical protein [Thermoplasmata archaeon]
MSERAPARGWGAAVAGFVITIVGVTVVLWAIWTSNPVAIPLNTTTYTGAGIAAVGVALAAIGFDRGAPRYG